MADDAVVGVDAEGGWLCGGALGGEWTYLVWVDTCKIVLGS